jgi:TrmH family RNA methyltransferase
MFEKINNTQSKHIKKLHRKKNRQIFNEFIVEGTKTVIEFAHSDYKCKGIYATEEWFSKHGRELSHFELFIVNSKQMDQISTFKNASTVLAVFQIQENTTNNTSYFILYLDDMRDPGNLGRIILSAEWFGLTEIYCSETCADNFNTKVIQASMGSASRIKVNFVDFKELIAENASHKAVLADMDGTSLKEYKWEGKNILVIGNEANGVSDDLKVLVPNKLTIEIKGKAESLNASISTAIILSHCF